MDAFNDPELHRNTQVLRASVNLLIDPILRMLQYDNHTWSTRPCSTCDTISHIVGRPFGCYVYRKEIEARAKKDK